MTRHEMTVGLEAAKALATAAATSFARAARALNSADRATALRYLEMADHQLGHLLTGRLAGSVIYPHSLKSIKAFLSSQVKAVGQSTKPD